MIETAYLLQSVLIISWWVGITLSDSFYEVFQFPGIEHDVFAAFLVPDIVVIAALSLFRGYRANRDSQLIILGAFLYATLFCVNASILGGGGLFPTLVMLIGLSYNVFLCYENRMFRTATASSLLANSLKTVIQIICIWVLTLGFIPLLILKTFGTPLTPVPGIHIWVAVFLFVLCGSLGLWSCYLVVKLGKGTPLPLDQTNELVTRGPYSYVRNPMAIVGTGQGFAVSIFYLSPPIFIFSALGVCVWHLVVRPIEEQDMHRRFGDSYRAYQKKVRCWVPRLKSDD